MCLSHFVPFTLCTVSYMGDLLCCLPWHSSHKFVHVHPCLVSFLFSFIVSSHTADQAPAHDYDHDSTEDETPGWLDPSLLLQDKTQLPNLGTQFDSMKEMLKEKLGMYLIVMTAALLRFKWHILPKMLYNNIVEYYLMTQITLTSVVLSELRESFWSTRKCTET